MCHYNGKWHIRLVYESKPLITVETAISSSIYMTFRSDEQQMLKTGRPPHSSRFFFFTCWPACGDLGQVFAKMGACRVISHSARSQNGFSGLVGWCSMDPASFFGSRMRRIQWGSVMRITWVSVFYLMAEIELWSSKRLPKKPSRD